MKGSFCRLLVLGALLTSGCGTTLFMNKITVECTQDNLSTNTSRIVNPDGRLIDQDELPSRSLDKEQPLNQSSSFHKFPDRESTAAIPPQTRFVLPVTNSSSIGSSCLTDDRDVQAIAQKTSVWCWAASAEAVMKFHTNSPNKSQCNIVNTTVREDGDPSGPNSTAFCCGDKYHRDCQRNGLPSWALKSYGFDWRMVQGPLKREKLAAQLCGYGPVIFILRYAGGGGHSFVIGGYEYDKRNKQLFLLVHDHSWIAPSEDADKLIPTPYMRWPYEDYIEGRWEGKRHEHYVTYVSITPPTTK